MLKGNQLPPWVAPAAVLLVILALFGISKKRHEAVENPLVDLAIITVGVFAMAAAFRWAFTKLGAPGGAVFFGSPATA